MSFDNNKHLREVLDTHKMCHVWKIQCKMPPKTKRFYPLVPK